MDVEVTRSGQATVVVPKGELDLAGSNQLKETLTSLIDKGQAELVLDLTATSYVDSSGLAALVEGMKRARANGGDIKLCGLQPDVRSIFDMTRLIKVLDVFLTRAEAVAAWG